MLDRFKTTNPIGCVAFTFILTIVAARWVSYVKPGFHFNIGGMHIHHYMYGIFMIAAAGYSALVFKGPRATFWIALLYGWGLGFTFDEMAMWLNSSINQSLRWNYEGVLIGILALIIIGLLSVAPRKKPEQENNDLGRTTIDVASAQQED